MLAGRGYEVVAVSGKPDADTISSSLARRASCGGRRSTSGRDRSRPRCGPARSTTSVASCSTWLTRTVDYWGNIASIGLAGSHELKAP